MPNWIEGTMKLRGKREDITRFFREGLEPSNWPKPEDRENQVVENGDDDYLDFSFLNEPHIVGTRRAFITDSGVDMEDDEGVVCVDVKQAWAFDAGSQTWNVLDSDNRRKKMAERAHNRVWSDESREKVSKNKKGKKLSEQARKNMSNAHKGKEGSNKKSIECIETKIVYESIKQASEDMGILRTSIQNVLSGLSENARGYHFRKVV